MCIALGTWGARWRESRPEHHDPYLALWSLAHLVDRSGLPQARVVVRFDITGGRGPHRYWLVVGPADREVCAHDPGHGDDAVVTCDPAALIAWHCGRLAAGCGDAGGHDGRHRAAVVGADARRVGAAEPLRRRRARRTGVEQRR